MLVSIGEADTPRYNAILLMSILTIINFLTMALVTSIALNKIVIVDQPKVILLLIGLLIIAGNSYLIFGRKKYVEIEQKYGNESEADRRANMWAATLYVAVTIAAFALCLVYLNNHPIRRGGIRH